MDQKEIFFRVIPELIDCLFPSIIMGEEIYYFIDECGSPTRVNKDVGKEEVDYIPNKIININPSNVLDRVKNYFRFSNFNDHQLIYIFKALDKHKESYQKKDLQGLVHFDFGNEIEFELIKISIKNTHAQLILNYNYLKEHLQENIPVQQEYLKNRELKFKNNFDSVSEANIYKYFKSQLVDKGYLSEVTLNKYLKAAFEQKIKIVSPFVFMNLPTKQIITRIFYKYYKDVAAKPHGRQKRYAELLGEYFKGYNSENVRTNFNK